MGRAPCCDKVGLKKGPWTPEEDQILVSFIHQHGHSNWRALPKQAGLLRCGKSCRLRWINYLRPDIKRGNFTKEEEDTIIHLHEMMGNRWSAIAGKLPGRTDNEIKNVWHTHLKKRLEQHQSTTKPQGKMTTTKRCNKANKNNSETITNSTTSTSDLVPSSSQQSYTTTSDGFSSVTEVSSMEVPSNSVEITEDDQLSTLDDFPIIDETFWSSQEFSPNDSGMTSVFDDIIDDNQLPLQFSEEDNTLGACNNFSSMYNNDDGPENYGDSMDFWLDVFVKAGGVPELPEF